MIKQITQIAWLCANRVDARESRGRVQFAWTSANRLEGQEREGGRQERCAGKRGAPAREVRRRERCAGERGAPAREARGGDKEGVISAS